MRKQWVLGRRSLLMLVALLLTLCSAASALGQARPKAQSPAQSSTRSSQSSASTTKQRPDSERAADSADISITATVTARELTFEAVPNVKVDFTGTFDRNTVWEAERDNLPTPVQPGVTYRNIGVRLTITSLFADIDRIVSEALGEAPPREREQREREQEAQPNANPPKSTQPARKPESRRPGGGTDR